MPTHYIFEDEPDNNSLCQGDVLRRTEELVAELQKYFPYYAAHADYRFFLVLTQSCDLVRRDGVRCNADYISLAAVRSIDDVVRLEAAKGQEPWQAATNVISMRLRAKLSQLLDRVIDNNEPGYFYLHQDASIGLQPECCAFLPLSVSLRAQHYPLCLAAKVAQLTEPFQAKLGWLLGHMYSRVGTSEWSMHNQDKVSKVSQGYLDRNFVAIDDKQIDEGIAEIKGQGPLTDKSPEDIKQYIIKTKVLPRKDKFKARAVYLLQDQLKPVEKIRKKVVGPIRSDEDIKEAISVILASNGVPEDKLLTCCEEILKKVSEKLGSLLSDEKMPGRKEVILAILNGLLQDSQITNILK
ncbi:hypothetical protein [Tuwongella immobilis]|uniref:Uncharacterized protein n=1 Tax=Tuwongella immobilis TaxID=692036 RepID=A0A6C2YJT4_9BACT|nr:hypothetical protein [Tuwongella immobilis]VIP01637.1 Uncharacterized protein OS=Firmicutes bacterium CAG:238 GN=BN553_00969 PE=4 SV=1 [Tuwongella immobilis]VTR98999.1 Uncharacterized protein OS=Firmicutes bacterium CAG:238 GN=BN553_00969 PE=4 SV=1 [Tuwongella immobilis]